MVYYYNVLVNRLYWYHYTEVNKVLYNCNILEKGDLMIKGLFESHLPVSNPEKSIVFYEKLGLELESIIPKKVAFLWIEKN